LLLAGTLSWFDTRFTNNHGSRAMNADGSFLFGTLAFQNRFTDQSGAE